MSSLEPSTFEEEQVIEEERNGVEPNPAPSGIGVYERPDRRISPAVIIGLVIFFLLLIAAAVILFVL